MKISKLHIDQFRHLKNLDFDFTYPKDFHISEKRGKPLEKICFIGQSATGKTNILNLIDIKTYNNSYQELPDEFKYNNSLEKLNTKLTVAFSDSTDDFLIENNKILIDYNLQDNNISTDVVKKIYFPAELNISEIINFLEIEDIEILEINSKLKNYNQIKLSNSNYKELYNILTYDFISYRERLYKKITELLKIKDIKKLVEDLNKWKIENPNPNDEFNLFFNKILTRLNLTVDLENVTNVLNFKKINSNESISINSLSTGTKLLISQFLPLYKFKTKDSIILIDEPERSLYPDMQMDLMEHYQNLATEAQFIVATHSPFIAASFEPEERFILYFDENGEVAVRRGSSPIGDDPNDILYNDFGIDYINKYGKKVYNDYLEKKRQLLFEEDEEVKEKLQNDIESIGDKYNF